MKNNLNMRLYSCIFVAFCLHYVSESNAKINPLPYSDIKNYLEGRLSTYDLFDNRPIRSKRSLTNYSSSEQIFRFTAFNRTFQLYLTPTPATSVSSNLSVSVMNPTTGDRTIVNSSELLTNFFSGYVIGDPNSTATGYLFNNQFVGTIHTGSGEVFNVESLSLLTGNISDTRLLGYYDHHMRDSPDTEPGICGYNKQDESAVVSPQHLQQPQQPPSSHRRRRRSTIGVTTADRLVCQIQIVADYAYFSRMGNDQLGATVRSIVQHIDDVNQIYAVTNLTDIRTKKPMPRLQFEITSLVVMTQPSKPDADKFMHFNAAFKDSTVFDSSLHLRSFGDSEHNKLDFTPYCLSHLFTYRRMKENVLGLAFLNVACDTDSLWRVPSIRRGPVAKSIGFTTHSDTHGYPLLFRRATLVTAHELAHNCGSEHDPKGKLECSPNALTGGAFLMNPISVLGYAKNNDKFSSCSVKQMSAYLTYNSRCLVQPKGILCGNHRVDEPTEECDAGLTGDDCCSPTCRLLPGAVCSHANSPCCKECKLAVKGSLCYNDAILLPCIKLRHCDGVSPTCPKPSPLPDGVECQNGIGKCHSGDCRSVCYPHRLCDCPDQKDSCHVCCGDAKTCTLYYKADRVSKIFLPPKSDCFAVGGVSGGHCHNGVCSPKAMQYSGRPVVRLFQAGSRPGNSIIFIVLLIGTLIYATGGILLRYFNRPTPGSNGEVDGDEITFQVTS